MFFAFRRQAEKCLKSYLCRNKKVQVQLRIRKCPFVFTVKSLHATNKDTQRPPAAKMYSGRKFCIFGPFFLSSFLCLSFFLSFFLFLSLASKLFSTSIRQARARQKVPFGGFLTSMWSVSQLRSLCRSLFFLRSLVRPSGP